MSAAGGGLAELDVCLSEPGIFRIACVYTADMRQQDV